MLLCLPSAVSGSTGNWTSLQIVQIYISEHSISVENLFRNKLIIHKQEQIFRLIKMLTKLKIGVVAKNLIFIVRFNLVWRLANLKTMMH